jgi:hypothetical protein
MNSQYNPFRSTNEFGTDHSLTGWHRGIDLIGFSNIRAAADGRVVFSGSNGTAGYEVKIRHTDLTATRYLHMKAGSLRVRTGDTVKRGDIIGVMGATGYADGPHLHFECLDVDDNRRINPRLYIGAGTAAGSGGVPFDPNGDDELNQDEKDKLDAIYGALVAPSANGPYYKTDALMNLIRTEVQKSLADIQAGKINYPNQDYNAFTAIVNEVRGQN